MLYNTSGRKKVIHEPQNKTNHGRKKHLSVSVYKKGLFLCAGLEIVMKPIILQTYVIFMSI